ncbi:hypothetical protein AEST_04770 [Alishewanella aestuarii B11]|uniref:Uncharacterized protein n=1 Tax=Alishewanella aestuarii B11 TaxID=1197174 RepID=J1QMU9_9ALTE|nr:hypothetical protein AEST_04770 [Alishewanella aestuarii B11]
MIARDSVSDPDGCSVSDPERYDMQQRYYNPGTAMAFALPDSH